MRSKIYSAHRIEAFILLGSRLKPIITPRLSGWIISSSYWWLVKLIVECTIVPMEIPVGKTSIHLHHLQQCSENCTLIDRPSEEKASPVRAAYNMHTDHRFGS
jgi:hypothetical protein